MSGLAFINEANDYFLADLFSSKNRTGQELSDQVIMRLGKLGIADVVKAKTKFIMSDQGSVAVRAAKNLKLWFDAEREESAHVQIQYCAMHTVRTISSCKNHLKILGEQYGQDHERESI